MDVRGIEVTNQLRSAIGAKLLELGVRYDEELPDYILVMVVNKKSRLQMHEDLHLFLENHTTPFVDWLHDQVLKKLQKVTILNKKLTKEFVPTIVVKQEEEKKKKKKISAEKSKIEEEPSIQIIIPRPIEISEKPIEERLNLVNDLPAIPPSRLQKEIQGVVEDRVEIVSLTSKRFLSKENTPEYTEKRLKSIEPPKESNIPGDEEKTPGKRLRSYVNKPKITSVVSVTTKLDVISPRKKFETHKYLETSRRGEKRSEKPLYEPVNLRQNFRRNFEEKKASVNNRILEAKETKFPVENSSGSVKDRLGNNRETLNNNPRSVRNRLGASKFRISGRLGPSPSQGIDLRDESQGDDVEEYMNVPIKSHIIAVNNVSAKKIDKRFPKIFHAQVEQEGMNNDTKALASKVIVTPRPLKPLQSNKKRATKSLLLRAVAEANQSVVKQKNPEPILPEKKAVLKRLRPTGTMNVGQNLSVHLNATKRLVMDKIQVEITNQDTAEPEPYVPRAVSDDQMEVVVSLFERSDNSQKFLVTLNGYDNNTLTESSLNDDERFEMTVNEDDELTLLNASNDSVENDNLSSDDFEVIGSDDIPEKIYENIENYCDENLNKNEDVSKKRRKLSPVVYTRSRSPSPENTKNWHTSQIITDSERRPVVIMNKKSQGKCRYWPNCSLGAKCAYVHPAVPCSVFPACKFGIKCAYKHPKCKFGLSCTKLGCVFVHPPQECKYHPYCTKPGCVYLHNSFIQAASPSDITRAKFTWHRQD